MEITRYAIKTEQLKPWVCFLWHFAQANAEIHQKLLPTDQIDVVVNLGAPMRYQTEAGEMVAPTVHLNGLRSVSSWIHQQGQIELWGISFPAYGLYPFVRQPLTATRDRLVDLSELSPQLTEDLWQAVGGSTENLPQVVAARTTEDAPEAPEAVRLAIEGVLLNHLQADDRLMEEAQLMQQFLQTEAMITIASFAEVYGISVKSFERLCRRLTGYPPSILRKVRRFQQVGNELVHGNAANQANLAAVAANHDFADQAHFNREFKKLSNESPRQFLKEGCSVKENAQYHYE